MKKDEAIIFDLDGTLSNTFPMSIEGSQYAIEHASCQKVTPEQIVGQFGKSDTALFKHYCPDTWQKAHQAYAQVFKDKVTEKTLFPGIKEVLSYLKENNIKTALVTGRGEETALIILEKAGIKDYFQYIKTGSETGSVKPQCIKEILAAWNQSPEKTFYVGDVVHDILDSKEAGVTPLSAAWAGTTKKEDLAKENPAEIFDTPQDLLNWIKE